MDEKRMKENFEDVKHYLEKLKNVRSEYFDLNPEFNELHEMNEWTEEQTKRYRLLSLAKSQLLMEWTNLETEIGKRFVWLLNDLDVIDIIENHIKTGGKSD